MQMLGLALVMSVPIMALLQLGSPVPPHFDVFAPLASAQRLVTWGTYYPWDNDAYGYYNMANPATELLYAILTLGGVVPYAVLGATAAIVPLGVLLMIGAYRLGRSLGGDEMGGVAALLVFATVMLRMMPTGHGRYVAFVPAVVGLAFLLDPRRHWLRLALGAMLLGVAVSAHVLIGGYAVITAAMVMLVWFLTGDFAGGLAGVGLVVGATLLTVPTLLADLPLRMPYPVCPIAQFLGLGLVVCAARRMPSRPSRDVRLILGPLTVGLVVWLWSFPSTLEMVHRHWADWRYPLLWMLGAAGLILAGVWPRRGTLAVPLVCLVAAGAVAELVGKPFMQAGGDPRVVIAARDFGSYKVDFWYPMALMFPAAYAVVTCRAVLGRWVTGTLVLLWLWFPWQYGAPPFRDPNYDQVSIAELWMQHLGYAKEGYWGSTGDRRWAQSPAEFALIAMIQQEIVAGRITPATHVAHLTPYVYLYQDTLLYSVYTGVNDDMYVAEYQFDYSNAGGRFYPAAKIHAALAARVPYVVIHDRTVNGRVLTDTFPDVLDLRGYRCLFESDGLRLFRAEEVL
jgi:hypothetical protein